MIREPHTMEGHFNIYILDHEDDCTGYGKHDRVMACCPEGSELYCRVDHKWNLGTPTPAQVLKAAKKRYQRGKWTLDRMEKSPDGKTTDYFFKQTQPNAKEA